MQPSFFGDARAPLYGVYHPPDGARERDAAVLVCPPGPHEYMRSHWALRKLAGRLAREGFHVLRFDYHATGDSAGDGSEGRLARWRQDVATALAELRDLAGVRRASVVGFRLGAALAAQASLRVRDLVLWEPVLDGPAYLAELRAFHDRSFAHCLNPPEPGPPGRLGELLGHPLPAEMEAEMRALRLSPPLACTAERVLVVAAAESPELRALAGALGAAATLAIVAEEGGAGEPFLLSTRSQERIAALLAGRAA